MAPLPNFLVNSKFGLEVDTNWSPLKGDLTCSWTGSKPSLLTSGPLLTAKVSTSPTPVPGTAPAPTPAPWPWNWELGVDAYNGEGGVLNIWAWPSSVFGNVLLNPSDAVLP